MARRGKNNNVQWDGPLALDFGGREMGETLRVNLFGHMPRRTGKGRASIQVRQGGGRFPRWTMWMNAYLGAQNYGAKIPDRPKPGTANPRIMTWISPSGKWVRRAKAKGYTIEPRGFIERAINDFIENDLLPAIGWAAAEVGP